MDTAFIGRLAIDLGIVVVAGEIAWFALRRGKGRGYFRGGLIANASAGLCLLLVARAVVNGNTGGLVLAALTAALLAHLVDLALRRQSVVRGSESS